MDEEELEFLDSLFSPQSPPLVPEPTDPPPTLLERIQAIHKPLLSMYVLSMLLLMGHLAVGALLVVRIAQAFDALSLAALCVILLCAVAASVQLYIYWKREIVILH